MEYNITYREKNAGLQAIISYKTELGKWKQKSKQGFPNSREGKRKAKKWADETLQTIKNNLANDINLDYENITWKDFCDIYIKHLTVHMQPKTIRAYKLSLLHFEDLNDIEISKLRPFHIQNCVDVLVQNKLKHSSIKAYLAKVKSILNAAINKYNIIITNPARNIIFQGNKDPLDKRALTIAELEDLLIKMSKIKEYQEFYIMSLFAGKCGLRLGETMGVKWSDIDFKNNVLLVRQQWKLLDEKEHYGFGPLKTLNSKRDVPLPLAVKKALIQYDSLKPRNIDNRVVRLKSVNGVGSNIQRIFRKVGYEISIHELRHTYATLLISNGIDFKTAAQLLGHTVEMTMRTYSHVTDDMIQKAAKIINQIM